MKKITFAFLSFLLFSTGLFAQVNSTGQIEFAPISSGLPYGAQIDVSASEVTLTFGGPADRWLGIGFGVQSMTSGGDVVVFDGTNLTDRTFMGIGTLPPLDTASGGSSDWTVVSIDTTTQPGLVGVIATRALTTGDASDYVFNLTDTSINLVWARGNATLNLSNHGNGNRGVISSAPFTLGVQEFQAGSKFTISPNPASTEFKVQLPNNIENASVEVYDVLGKQVHSTQVSEFDATINVSDWNSGIYLVRVSSGDISQTKRFIKQ